MPVAKNIELVGSSSKSWEDAVYSAFNEAKKTLRNIRRIKVLSYSAIVEGNEIKEYRARVKITFLVER
ncbi:MAG: dodecin domain-containing protein [Thermoproteota archaeon]|nr:MAG: dodecin domain-containing protein [Candidatus Korarchaeota archaeon]